MKPKNKNFSKRLKCLLYNDQQPERSKCNTSGVSANYGVTNGSDVDATVPASVALKGKGVKYE